MPIHIKIFLFLSCSQDGFADFTSFSSSQTPAKSSSSDLFDVFSSNTNSMQSNVPIQPMNQGLMGTQPMGMGSQPMGQNQMNISAPGLNVMSSGAATGLPAGNVMGQPMMSQQPMMMSQQSGMMSSQPRMTSQPGMMTSQPGMMSSQPGMMGMQQPVSNFYRHLP